MRVIGKPLDGVADHCSYPSACGRILSDVPPDPFEIVQCCSAPNDLPAKLLALRLRQRKFVIRTPRFHPGHDLLVRHSGGARLVLFECLLNVRDLPGIDADIGFDCRTRETRLAAFHVARQRFELVTDLRLEPFGHRGAFAMLERPD